MESIINDILTPLGIPSGLSLLLYLIIKRETEHRKEERNTQMKLLEKRVEACEKQMLSYENSLDKHINKIYERLNPMSDAVNKILGYMEAKNDKGR